MMTKKQLTKLNKFKKSSLPILTCALIDSESITAVQPEDLYYTVRHGLSVEGTHVVPIEQFVKIARKYDIEQIRHGVGLHSIDIVTKAGTFTLTGEEPEHFPSIPSAPEKSQALHVSRELLAEYNTYASDDDLRPAMCGVYFGADMVATNGHVLKWHALTDAPESPYIMPSDTITLLTEASYAVSHFSDPDRIGRNLLSLSGQTEQIICETIDEKYPDYKSVIPAPADDGMILKIDSAAIGKAIQAAGIVAGNGNLRLSPSGAGAVTLLSEDVDTGRSFRAENIATAEGARFDIGFNSEYLSQALKNAGSAPRIECSGPNRAGIVNRTTQGGTLIIPVMLNTYV